MTIDVLNKCGQDCEVSFHLLNCGACVSHASSEGPIDVSQYRRLIWFNTNENQPVRENYSPFNMVCCCVHGCSNVQADKTLKICLAKKIPVDRNYNERTVLLSLTAPHSTMGNITNKCFLPIQLCWEVFPVFTLYIYSNIVNIEMILLHFLFGH